MSEVRPLFIPLARKWFDAFASGEKNQEWRRYGARWNERVCAMGRPVLLSLGYTRTRLPGRIIGFERVPAAGPAIEIYGADAECALIHIALTK